jgi:hypothetical protein
MAKNQKKKQQAAMKKRRKDKVRHKQSTKALAQPSAKALIKGARKFPFMECWISAGWDTEGASGLVTVLIAREQPDGHVLFASYLLDIYCLGLKSTMYNANVPRSEFRQVVDQVFVQMEPESCSPELAHQMVYEAIDYAAQFDFKPHRDFKLAKYILDPPGSLATPHDLTFGKDGKPLFINGPYDDVDAIVAKLNKNPGEGNYHYLVQVGESEEFEELDEPDDA